MKTEEEVRKEYTHGQSNVNIMAEVCKRLSDSNATHKPTDRLEWWKGYVAALLWWLE